MNNEHIQDDAKTKSATNIAEGLPPIPTQDSTTEDIPSIGETEPTAMQLFLAWEKWRILYNVGVIILAVWVASGNSLWSWDRTVQEFIITILYTNLSVCTGPFIESYLCCFGMPRLAARGLSLLVIGVVNLAMVNKRMKDDMMDRLL
jgi:hypothetical protein